MRLDGWMIWDDVGNVLANSASNLSRMNPYSISSRALNTSAGMMVFFPDDTVCSFALLIDFRQ